MPLAVLNCILWTSQNLAMIRSSSRRLPKFKFRLPSISANSTTNDHHNELQLESATTDGNRFFHSLFFLMSYRHDDNNYHDNNNRTTTTTQHKHDDDSATPRNRGDFQIFFSLFFFSIV